MDSMDLAREAVSRGIAVLDKHGPKDWRSKIDLETLSIEDGYQCVLGQVYEQAWIKDGSPTLMPFTYGRNDLAARAGLSVLDESAAWFMFPPDHGFVDFITDDPDHDASDDASDSEIAVSSEDLDRAWIEALS